MRFLIDWLIFKTRVQAVLGDFSQERDLQIYVFSGLTWLDNSNIFFLWGNNINQTFGRWPLVFILFLHFSSHVDRQSGDGWLLTREGLTNTRASLLWFNVTIEVSATKCYSYIFETKFMHWWVTSHKRGTYKFTCSLFLQLVLLLNWQFSRIFSLWSTCIHVVMGDFSEEMDLPIYTCFGFIDWFLVTVSLLVQNWICLQSFHIFFFFASKLWSGPCSYWSGILCLWFFHFTFLVNNTLCIDTQCLPVWSSSITQW